MLRGQKRWAACALASIFGGCAEPPPAVVVAPPRNLQAERRLAAAAAAREGAEARLAAVDARSRERCEFQVGDCQILINEQRDELMSAEQLSACNVMPEPAAKTRCMADELVKRHKHVELAAFYANDSACMRTVLACTDQLSQSAVQAAVELRAGRRERELGALPRGAAALSRTTIIQAKIGYLRSTLPPPQAKACEPSDEVDRCSRAAMEYEDQLESELDKDDYHPDVALGLLEQLAKASSLCLEPELACLGATLEAHGVYPEAKKWVARNLALLERREEIGSALPPSARARCVKGASNEHQARIVAAYVAYAREPVLYFRVQLDKAFLAMHESEVACLGANTGRRTTGPAALSSMR